jgi:hypothetical protein
MNLARSRFSPRVDDIYIATYPRSGTSLVQMMLYQLTTDGAVGFRHIDEVIPFLEHSLQNGHTLDGLPSPRILKTHLPQRLVSGWPGRYIYICRDGRDVAVSYFHLYKTYVSPTLTFPDFFEKFLAGQLKYGSWFQHVLGWEARREEPNFTLLHYEDLVQNLGRCLEQVTSFLGWTISAEQRTRVLDRCKFAFMRQHENRFAPANSPLGPGTSSSTPGRFIRQGRIGSWKQELTSEQVLRFNQTARMYFANIDRL